MKRLLFVLIVVIFALPLTVSGQATQEPNPNAQITWPPPVYVLRGQFEIRGTANLPNMNSYFIEGQALNDDLTPIGGSDAWFPVILSSTASVQDGVLGTWDTTFVSDGLYQLRLTVTQLQGSPMFDIVSPLRVENTPPPFAVQPTPTATITLSFPTDTPMPTQDTTPRVTISVGGGGNGNVRSGDSVFYNILTSLPSGTSARILGISNRGTGWYQIQLDNGQIGWVAPSIVTTSGDLTNLQRIEPPPPPPPTATPFPTAIPATPMPISQANLIPGIVAYDPPSPTCQQTFTVGLDVANVGSQPTSTSGIVSLTDTRAADGSVQGSTTGGFPVLAAGQTFRVNMPLTISTWYNEQHNITLVIDPNNQIPELNEGDNTITVSYTLQKGGCP